MLKLALLAGFILSLFVTAGAAGQYVLPPPTVHYPGFGQTRFLPALRLWIAYDDNVAANPDPGLDRAVTGGLLLQVFRSRLVSVEAEARVNFRSPAYPISEEEEHGWYLFGGPSAVSNSDANGRWSVWIPAGDFAIGPSFLASEYALRQPSDELTVSRLSVGLSLTRKPILLRWASGNATSLAFRADAYYVLPVADFGEVTMSPDRFRFDASMHADAFRVGRLATVFVEGGSAFTVRTDTASVRATAPVNLDWHVRAGLHAPSAIRGFSAYMQVQRATDPWTTVDPRPVTTVSMGFSLALTFGAVE